MLRRQICVRLARLIKRAAEWSSGGKERRNLATGGELDLYKGIADRRKSWLSQTEIAFVEAAARWAMIRRFAGIAAVLALVVTSAAMTYLWITANQSARQSRRRREERSRCQRDAGRLRLCPVSHSKARTRMMHSNSLWRLGRDRISDSASSAATNHKGPFPRDGGPPRSRAGHEA